MKSPTLKSLSMSVVSIGISPSVDSQTVGAAHEQVMTALRNHRRRGNGSDEHRHGIAVRAHLEETITTRRNRVWCVGVVVDLHEVITRAAWAAGAQLGNQCRTRHISCNCAGARAVHDDGSGCTVDVQEEGFVSLDVSIRTDRNRERLDLLAGSEGDGATANRHVVVPCQRKYRRWPFRQPCLRSRQCRQTAPVLKVPT